MSQAPQSQDQYYDLHLFFCTNERPDGHKRGSCFRAGQAARLRNYMKARVKELELPKVRVNNAGCLDRCELGPVMVIYPQGVWYRYDSEADVDEILSTHLQNGQIVERLRLAPEDR